ncbi:hypothetical protein HDV02_006428 [Globomyces sp. JEL0801]|nr:hypothetical protein HDV02_006428 [Globomyces sp. JEL0801]
MYSPSIQIVDRMHLIRDCIEPNRLISLCQYKQYKTIQPYIYRFIHQIPHSILTQLFIYSALDGQYELFQFLLQNSNSNVYLSEDLSDRWNEKQFLSEATIRYLEMLKSLGKQMIDNAIINYILINGYLDCLQLLLDSKFVLDIQDMICCAAGNNQPKCLKLLLEHERTFNMTFDEQAISQCAFFGFSECLEIMLEDDRLSSQLDLEDLFKLVASKGYVKCLKLFLSNDKVDPTSDDNFALICAIYTGRIDCIQLLLEDSRIDPSANHNLPLRIAAIYGVTEALKLLLADSRVDPMDFDPEDPNDFSLGQAAAFGHLECVQVLLQDDRVDVTAAITKVLKLAMDHDQAECIEYLQNNMMSQHLNESRNTALPIF